MSVVLRSAVIAPPKPIAPKSTIKPLGALNQNNVVLPTSYSDPSGELQQYTYIIHGDKKVG